MLYAIADLAARHAIAVLIVITIATLALSAAVWHVLVTVGPRTWSLAIDLWNRTRQTRLARRLRELPMLGRALSGTLTIARYLGIVAIVGFALSAGAIVLFFELADEIGVNESFAEFDVALSAALLNRILKAIFERSRPLHDHGLTVEGGWSFPSGHASGSMLVYGLLAYLVVRSTPPAWHVPAALAGITLIIFVGSSRVLLQVHYLSDVLAGYASATAWVAICIAALEAVRWRELQR